MFSEIKRCTSIFPLLFIASFDPFLSSSHAPDQLIVHPTGWLPLGGIDWEPVGDYLFWKASLTTRGSAELEEQEQRSCQAAARSHFQSKRPDR